ncbi:MAG: trigger factor [Clostridiales bacterium]|nr:trigger factor [Clostridiales bacterium]
MNYTQATGEKSTVKLTITFTQEEWKNAIAKAYLKTRGKYTVPGFRKGKAPQPVLENYYGKGVFFEEAFNALYSEHYFAILEKEKDNFTAVGEPELNVESMEEGKGVVLSAIVPVKPEVKIEKYTGLKIQKFEYNVTDEDVEKEAKKLVASDAKTVEVEDRACKLGDIVNIDFSGSVDGVKFEGGTAEGYDLELGSGSFIPGFEDALVGMNKGEEKDINVKFPEEYQAENLRGKDAVFAVKINKITERQYPELTDEYVKAHAGVETVADYKKKLRERLEKSAENRGRDETEGSILAEISKHTEVEVPDAMIESEIDRIVQDFSYRLMYQGLKLDDYLKYMNTTMKDFRARYTDEAHRRVVSQLVVDKIVKTENFKAEPEEVDAKIEEQAKSVEKTFEEYKKTIDPRQVEYITNDIIITKLFDFLKANNEMYVEEKKEAKPAAKKTASKSTAKKTAEKTDAE